MQDRTYLALEAMRRLDQSPAMSGLSAAERDALHRDVERLRAALGEGLGEEEEPDPYAAILATPADLQRDLDRGRTGSGGAATNPGPPPAESSSRGPAAPTRAVDQIGGQTASTLDAIDFPNFVAGLVTGTFDAIVRSTSEQMREYASLVASLSQSAETFSRDNVSENQVRDWLAETYPSDLQVQLPEAGSRAEPRLTPRERARGSSPSWLANYGLAGRELEDELTEGALLRSGRLALAEQRMQSLANMVLMGINRVVIDRGNITARLNFHAKARDTTQVQLQAMSAGQKAGIAARQTQLSRGATTMVSTVSANVQSDTQIRADLLGEVNVQFSTESFPLERFADSAAIQLINRHARWTAPADAPPPSASSPSPAVTPSTAPSNPEPSTPTPGETP